MADAEAGKNTRYAITVRFALHEAARERFLALIEQNAATSVREEPGCLQFDVLTPLAGPDSKSYVLLYEIYTDRAALDAHVKTQHFQAFDVASRDLVARKDVLEFATEVRRK